MIVVSYEYITKYDSPNFAAGRPAGRPAFIVIHHWGNDGQKFQNVVNYLCRKGGNTSAHYVVEAGRVACIVDPDDRAWHAGSEGNPRGIGIECRPEMSAGDLETVAELIADLRNTYGNLPLYPHKKFVATACPGRWEGKLDWLSRRADEILRGGVSKVADVVLPSGSPSTGLKPVYRLYNGKSGSHFFTVDENEAKELGKMGDWKIEGIAFWAFPSSK